MILSEHKRRWMEIRFYYFCYDIFQLKKDMLDVVLVIEAVSQIGTIHKGKLKNVSGKMLGDPYYLPQELELILLANIMGVPKNQIADYTGKTRQAIGYIIKTKTEEYNPIPKLSIDEDEEIIKFMELVDVIKKAGV